VLLAGGLLLRRLVGVGRAQRLDQQLGVRLQHFEELLHLGDRQLGELRVVAAHELVQRAPDTKPEGVELDGDGVDPSHQSQRLRGAEPQALHLAQGVGDLQTDLVDLAYQLIDP